MPTETFYNLPEAKRQKFLDCAIEEFAKNDYDSASISKIVARAGIAKGSLYQYFTDKRDLYHYLLNLAAQKKAEMLKSQPAPDDNMGLFEILRRLFQTMSGYELRYPKLASIGNRAIRSKSPLPEDLVDKGRQASQKYFQSLIEQGKQRGEIRSDVNTEMVAFIFVTLISEMGLLLKNRIGISSKGIADDSAIELNTAEVEKSYNQIISILKDGIATR